MRYRIKPIGQRCFRAKLFRRRTLDIRQTDNARENIRIRRKNQVGNCWHGVDHPIRQEGRLAVDAHGENVYGTSLSSSKQRP